jgi:hypothetical protein
LQAWIQPKPADNVWLFAKPPGGIILFTEALSFASISSSDDLHQLETLTVKIY